MIANLTVIIEEENKYTTKQLISGDIPKSNFEQIKELCDFHPNFKAMIETWDKIVVSFDSREIVMGVSSEYAHYSPVFVFEDYFENNKWFIITEETDIIIKERIIKRCHDTKGNLVWTKVAYHPNYIVEWDNINQYSNLRRSKIFNFFNNNNTKEKDIEDVK